MREKMGKLIHKLGYIGLLLVIYIGTKLFFRLKIKGKENIPRQTEDLLITSTHSSYWDPPIIGITFGPRREVHFIAREGLLENPLFSLPVKTYSTTINRDDFSKNDLVNMLKAFNRKGPVCVFPEGTTSEGSPPKSGTIKLAERTNRKFLPLKIEYLRSPTEFPFFFAPANLTIGEPLELDDLKRSAPRKKSGNSKAGNDPDYETLSIRLMDHIRQL